MVEKKTLMSVLCCAALMMMLSACGGSAPPEAPQSVEDRILMRWQHMVDRDFDQAWEFFTPGFRQLTPRETFVAQMASRPVLWHAAELMDVECEEDRCKATLRVTIQPVGGPSALRHLHVPSQVEETWLLMDGVWWFSQN